MKKTLLLFGLGTVLSLGADAQFKNLLKKDSTGKTGADKIVAKATGNKTSGLSAEEVANGLKEALSVGANNAGSRLSVVDGFFKDAALKILMPAEAQKVEKKLRALGMGKLVDDAILAMNRSAEDAAKSAAPIFVNAIKGMTIQDAFGILRGNNTAATDYLKSRTTAPLTEAFRPVIETSLQKTNATKYWETVFNAYNKVSKDKINPDLAAYVTEKSMYGIFYQVALEEQKIRKDPMARTSDLLKKVFAN